MVNITYGYVFSLFCALVVIIGDYLIKRAADDELSLASAVFAAGLGLYAVSAVLWYFAMRHITLAQAGVAYSMLTLIALSLMGVVFFDERLLGREVLGIGFALASMALMTRII